jgi:NADH-quinone oxidoreductase subunit N
MTEVTRLFGSLGINFAAIGPEIALVTTACVILLLDCFYKRPSGGHLLSIGLIGLLVAGWLSFNVNPQQGFTAYYDNIGVDAFSRFAKLALCGITALTFLMSAGYALRREVESAEYYALMLLATVGMMFMASGTDLIMIFLGLEISSISQYILAGFRQNAPRSTEASLKYFILGAFATGFLVYGIALVYGAAGSTNLAAIRAYTSNVDGAPLLLMAGCALLLVGFGFKVSSVPFHMWTPDVYDGAPTTITAFMAAASKVAGFAALMRILFVAFTDMHSGWGQAVWVIAALTMTLGNIAALAQTRVKRMLAYSAIANAGYLLVAIVPGSQLGGVGALYYLVAYAVTNIGAFAIVGLLRSEDDEGLKLSNFAGLGYRRPWLGLLMALFMFSLAGIPPTAGFIGKFYIFSGAIEAGYIGLAVLGVINSVISVYYYLRVVVWMYMTPDPGGEDPLVRASWPVAATLAVSAIGVLQLGVWPMPLYEIARRAIASLLG